MNSLAIARIFGGFPSSFYFTYHEYQPKSKPVEEYEQRMHLYELIHYLNHTLIFGVSRCTFLFPNVVKSHERIRVLTDLLDISDSLGIPGSLNRL